jgi:hypothetical protein
MEFKSTLRLKVGFYECLQVGVDVRIRGGHLKGICLELGGQYLK